MKRPLLNLLTVVSVVVALVGAAVWARGYFVLDHLVVERGKKSFSFFSSGGGYVFVASENQTDYGNAWLWEPAAEKVHLNPASAARALINFRWSRSPLFVNQAPTLYIAVPQWTIPAVFGVLPAVRFLCRRRRHRRTAANACPRCGYDLRATPDRWPECGTQVFRP